MWAAGPPNAVTPSLRKSAASSRRVPWVVTAPILLGVQIVVRCRYHRGGQVDHGAMDTSVTFTVSGIVFGLAAGFAPGPLLALVLVQSVQYGVTEGLKVAVSPLVSDPPIILFSLLIFTKAMTVDSILGVVALAGGSFLMYLAIKTVRNSSCQAQARGFEARSLRMRSDHQSLKPTPVSVLDDRRRTYCDQGGSSW